MEPLEDRDKLNEMPGRLLAIDELTAKADALEYSETETVVVDDVATVIG